MLTTVLSFYIASVLSTNTSFEKDFNQNTNLTEVQHLYIKSRIAPIPVKKPDHISPVIHAAAAIAIDLKTGDILYQKNAHERKAFASLTKLMTALIILEENKLDETVTVSGNAAATPEKKMWLRTGEKIKVQNLLYGILVHSANDAAIALAEHNAGSVEEFVKKMNKKATKLRLQNTHFANPTGFDNPQNYSSTYDLSVIAKYMYQKQFVRHTGVLSNIEVKSEKGGIKHTLESTNKLLGNYLGFKGLKTGTTELAGQCFIGIIENPEGHEILTIVLNSPNRFKESKILADWVSRAYVW